jgi:hypothetical protein
MCPLIVSEKTLELNIGAEILQLIRKKPGCSRAFWIGMKQDQEASNGIDELISSVPTGMHLALQFKSPRSLPRNAVPYRFTINDIQNNNLLRLAAIRPNAVFYVLPHYNTFTKMRSDSPVLLKDTWLLRTRDLRNLPPSGNRSGTHTVESAPPIAIVHSKPYPTETLNAGKVIDSLFVDGKNLEAKLLNHTDIKDWLRKIIDEGAGNKRAIGQRLRGFSTFCIS